MKVLVVNDANSKVFCSLLYILNSNIISSFNDILPILYSIDINCLLFEILLKLKDLLLH
jgi:hypothetical protein